MCERSTNQGCGSKLPQSRRSQDFLKIALTDVTISSYEIADGAAVDPMDQFVLGFAKIQFDYLQQKPDGTTAASIEAGWDVTNNKAA
jgi:type VI secretion system secreted protein Hcp